MPVPHALPFSVLNISFQTPSIRYLRWIQKLWSTLILFKNSMSYAHASLTCPSLINFRSSSRICYFVQPAGALLNISLVISGVLSKTYLFCCWTRVSGTCHNQPLPRAFPSQFLRRLERVFRLGEIGSKWMYPTRDPPAKLCGASSKQNGAVKKLILPAPDCLPKLNVAVCEIKKGSLLSERPSNIQVWNKWSVWSYCTPAIDSQFPASPKHVDQVAQNFVKQKNNFLNTKVLPRAINTIFLLCFDFTIL